MLNNNVLISAEQQEDKQKTNFSKLVTAYEKSDKNSKLNLEIEEIARHFNHQSPIIVFPQYISTNTSAMASRRQIDFNASRIARFQRQLAYGSRTYDRSIEPIIFGSLYNTTEATSLINSIISQEALTGQREKIRQDYVKMTTEGESANLISKFLPSPEEADTGFEECFKGLTNVFDVLSRLKSSESVKFRLNNAQRTLNLMNGDESIEHHAVSSIQQYKEYSYPDLPNLRQLAVLAYHLGRVDTKNFVKSIMVEGYSTPSKWQEFIHPFINSQFKNIVNYEDVGQSLSADRVQGSPFVNALATVLENGDFLPALGTTKIVSTLFKAYFNKRIEQMMPVIEALFMVMRGHNIELLNSNEPNRPACAEGAYLGILKSIIELVPTTDSYFSNLTIQDCNNIN